jgi:UDP-N-acetyl-D-mannosaminuronate dehydrogenase
MLQNVNTPAVGILGPGEVGLSIKSLYSLHNIEVVTKDKNDTFIFNKLDVLNVCIPFNEQFIDTLKKEIVSCKPELVIIHSTVPIGTTAKLNLELQNNYNIVHSPIRGNHPNLTKSLQTFVKYVGSNNPRAIKLATDHLRTLSVSVHGVNASEKTEAAKLLCTTYYGLCIAWHNEMKKLCDQYDIEFDFIKGWNASYNKGYQEMGLEKFNRPVLDPPNDNKIGGHCVIPNAILLDALMQSTLIKEVIAYK